MTRRFELTIPLPVTTINAERSGNLWDHRRNTAEWRNATWLLARQARIPRLERIAVEATPYGPRIRQDVGACAPSVKAAIDGLVDLRENGRTITRVLPDDTPKHVVRLTFHQPRIGKHGLHLVLIDLADEAPTWGTYEATLPLGAPST